MSVVAPPSSNTEIGNAGAGNSVTQLSAIAWATSNIDINTIQASRLFPTFSSGANREFAWFHSKKFRVMWVRGITNGGSGSSASITSPNSSSGQNYSYRYDTYSTIQLTCSPTYPATFSHWAYGTSTAPLPSSISTSNPVSIASTDWTGTEYFNIWCVCNSAAISSFCAITGFDDGVNTVVPTNDGTKIYCGGRFTTYNGSSCNGIVRLNTDGTIDTGFSVGTGFNIGSGTEVWKILVQSNDKIIVIGEFTSYKGTTYNRIVRLNTDGTVDSGFSIGTGLNNSGLNGVLQSDGKVIVVGDFTSYNGATVSYIVRLNTDGTRDTGFSSGSGLGGTYKQLWGVDVQTDGKIVIAGAFTSYNGTSRNHICRINSDGTIDTSFNPGTGIASIFAYPMNSVKVLGNGKIIAGGGFYSYNGNTANSAVRINSDGSYDSGFAFRVSDGGYYVANIYETSIGKYLFVGNFQNYDYDNTLKDSLIMTNTDGTIYTTFDVGTYSVQTIAQAAAEMPSGQFFVGGYITDYRDGATSYGDNLILLNYGGDPVSTCFYVVTWDYDQSSPQGDLTITKNGTNQVVATTTQFGSFNINFGDYINADVYTVASKFMLASAYGEIIDSTGTLWSATDSPGSSTAFVSSPNEYPVGATNVNGISSEY
jgi:uncharacterized delta-60 repeat protein